MSVNFDSEFKAIICNSSAIINSLSGVIMGMNMFNRGLKYNYRFYSLISNKNKQYSEVGLYKLNNLAMTGQKQGDDEYNEAIDKEFICLLMHGGTYTKVYTSVLMARQAYSVGKSYIYNFKIPGVGSKNYNESYILSLYNSAQSDTNCAIILGSDNISKCSEFFNGF